jgi:hypothetical protein
MFRSGTTFPHMSLNYATFIPLINRYLHVGTTFLSIHHHQMPTRPTRELVLPTRLEWWLLCHSMMAVPQAINKSGVPLPHVVLVLVLLLVLVLVPGIISGRPLAAT